MSMVLISPLAIAHLPDSHLLPGTLGDSVGYHVVEIDRFGPRADVILK